MLALLAAFLIQDSAADLLKKVEEKYVAAATLTVTIEIRHAGKVQDTTFDDPWYGSLSSKGTGLMRMEIGASMGCKFPMPRTTYVSDGKNLAFSIGKDPPQKKAHVLALGTWSRRDLVRGGLIGCMGSAYGAIFLARSVKLESLFKVSGVSDGGAEKVNGVECRIVAFTATPPERSAVPLKSRVWIDPKNLVVLKRESVKRSKSESITDTETYASPVFDAKIEDDIFKTQ